jgi:ABC-2 type transport system ATP-binding protein
MIEIVGVSKHYGDTAAVANLSFTVPSGQVTGFLGPNGSGKSTTMRMILGLDRPDTGFVRVNGRRYVDEQLPLTQVGSLLEARSVHPGRTAVNHLRFLAASNGIARSRVDEVIEFVGLESVAGRRAGSFSLGMGQRLGIATALLGDPPILILDEPVNGLDPEGIIWVRTLLRGLAAEGRTILVSSHLMTEMSMTADQLVVIGRGRLIADTTVTEFVASAGGAKVLVSSDQPTEMTAALAEAEVEEQPNGTLLVSGLTAAEIGQRALTAQIPLTQLSTQNPSLEEAFMSLTSGDVVYHGRTLASEGGIQATSDTAAETAPPPDTAAETAPPPDTAAETAPPPDTAAEAAPPPDTAAEAAPPSDTAAEAAAPANTAAAAAAGDAPAKKRTPFFSDLWRGIRAEWRKFISLRSTKWSLLLTFVIVVAFGGIAAYGTTLRWDDFSPLRRAVFDPTAQSLGGIFFGQLVLGALGVLVLSSEYSSGSIRATMAAIPRRSRVLLAKILVLGGAGLVVATATMFAAFFFTQWMLRPIEVQDTLATPNTLRAIIGASLFLVAVALLGLGLAAVLRHTAGAISTLFGLLLVLPLLVNFLPEEWQAEINPYLPVIAGLRIVQTKPVVPGFDPWVSLLLMFGYATVALLIGVFLLRRRDV